MKQYRSILVVILSLFFMPTFAHQDYWTTMDYGNVKVRVKTGFDYEEINKAFIIGQLAEKLAKGLDYSGPIFLDFNHYYLEDCVPTYFISYDKGTIEHNWDSDSKEKDYLKSKAIVVRQISRQFNVISTLKLLEYSLKNISKIKALQKKITYSQHYCDWKINSIDTFHIKEQLKIPNSELLNKIIKQRIYRPDKEFKYGISYFWQNNMFHLFLRDYKKADSTLANIDNIYEIKKFGNSSALVFDSDNSFFYVSQNNKTYVSQKHVINNTFDYYRPYNVENISRDKLSINFSYYPNKSERQPKEITLIYLTDKDELIQDLDKLLELIKSR